MEISGAELALLRRLKLRRGYFPPKSTSRWIRLWEGLLLEWSGSLRPGQHPERYWAVNYCQTINSPSGRRKECSGVGPRGDLDGAPQHLRYLKGKRSWDKSFAVDTLFGKWSQGARVGTREWKRRKKSQCKGVFFSGLLLWKMAAQFCEIFWGTLDVLQKFLPGGKKREAFINWFPLIKGGAMGIKLPCAFECPTHECRECQEKVLSKFVEAGV